jgi:hypothetical protein
MLEEPVVRECFTFSEEVNGCFGDVQDRGVESGDLGGAKGARVLFWVKTGVVEDFVAGEGEERGVSLGIFWPACRWVVRRGVMFWGGGEEKNSPDPVPDSADTGLVQQQRLDGNILPRHQL